jgi:hypothetical protein
MREYTQQYLTTISPQRITENSFYVSPSGQDQLLGTNRIIQRL